MFQSKDLNIGHNIYAVFEKPIPLSQHCKVDKCFVITKQWVFTYSALVCWEWTEQERLPPSKCWLETLAPLMAQHRSGTGMGKLFINSFVLHQAHTTQTWEKETQDSMRFVCFPLVAFPLLFIHDYLRYTPANWRWFTRISLEDTTETKPTTRIKLWFHFNRCPSCTV